MKCKFAGCGGHVHIPKGLKNTRILFSTCLLHRHMEILSRGTVYGTKYESNILFSKFCVKYIKVFIKGVDDYE